jgi:hypothetical protein
VDDATKAALIAGGVGVTEDNFTALWNIGNIILSLWTAALGVKA